MKIKDQISDGDWDIGSTGKVDNGKTGWGGLLGVGKGKVGKDDI
jgi:hypothetical protein